MLFGTTMLMRLQRQKFVAMFDKFDCLNVCSITEHLAKRKPDLQPYHSISDARLNIWRNGPYIGGHLAFFFKLNFKHVYNLR